MNKEILVVVEAVSNEKSVPRERIFEALEVAIVAATHRRYGKNLAIRVRVDRESGDFATFRRWLVVDEVVQRDTQLSLPQAQAYDPRAMLGKYVEKRIRSVSLDRTAWQIAKQVIAQRLREAERRAAVEQFRHRRNRLVCGTVERTTRDGTVLRFGPHARAFLSKKRTLHGETFRPGDDVKSVLYAVRTQLRIPFLLSRSCVRMVHELLRAEVPEVRQGLVDVKSIVRDSGSRTKVAVVSRRPRIDPVEACVGPRGSRIRSVSNELQNERIDVVSWSRNPVRFVANALSSTSIDSVVVDEDRRRMDVAVAEHCLAQTIGRNGQNIRLVSQLCGWNVNVQTVEESTRRLRRESQDWVDRLSTALNISIRRARALVRHGVVSSSVLACLSSAALSTVKACDRETLSLLRRKARNAAVVDALLDTMKTYLRTPRKELLSFVEGRRALASELTQRGIVTPEDLADQSVDALLHIPGCSPHTAETIIMRARGACGFRRTPPSTKTVQYNASVD